MKTRKKSETLQPGSDIVDEAMHKLPAQERAMMRRLRNLIQDCLPKASELAYYGLGVPFYRHNRLICFLWPTCFGWGPKRSMKPQKPKGLALGFCQGYLMSNEGGHLHAEGRKQVYCMYFDKPEDIDEALVRALLFEAGLIDEGFAKKKRKR